MVDVRHIQKANLMFRFWNWLMNLLPQKRRFSKTLFPLDERGRLLCILFLPDKSVIGLGGKFVVVELNPLLDVPDGQRRIFTTDQINPLSIMTDLAIFRSYVNSAIIAGTRQTTSIISPHVL